MSKIALTPNASGTGVFTIASPATNTDRTLTLPDEAGSIVVNTATGIDVTGTGTFSGAITANDGILIPSGEANPVNAYGATTGGSAFAIANTGGTSYFGNESSVAGTSASGTSAYATIIGTGAARELNFYTSGVTRMVVSSSGNVLVNKNSAYGAKLEVTASAEVAVFQNTGGTGNVRFHNSGGTTIGYIQWSGSSTSYNTSSDYRLKTDAQPMVGASDRVLALKPVNFEWISSGERVDGFLAHEAQAVVPEAVHGTKDGMEDYEITPAVLDDDGNVTTEAVMGTRPDYQGIDQSKLVPLLTAALQEALTEISALKVRVAALEAV